MGISQICLDMQTPFSQIDPVSGPLAQDEGVELSSKDQLTLLSVEINVHGQKQLVNISMCVPVNQSRWKQIKTIW